MEPPGEGLAEGCAVGSFEPCPIQRLRGFLAERDEGELKRRLREELGVKDDTFATVLRKSHAVCCRGCLLYPTAEELAISFNGGKDACVVLYLWLVALACSREAGAPLPGVIFFDSSKEFPSILRFVAWVVRSLNLRMLPIEQSSFRKGMEDLVERGVRAVVMGQRHGDPWMANVDAFSPSTDGWPPFMRINPIIDWSYSHVWTFLRAFGLPYCELYDRGYTSLGSVDDTLPNPALLRPDGSYAPACELEDATLERAGRVSSNGAKKRKSEGEQAEAAAQPAAAPEAAAQEPPVPRSRSMSAARTAGVVVVGNEILSGKVHDANARHICEELHGRGVRVTCVEVVPDEIEAIAASVRRVSDACELVFSSGGLGPTHDDLTMAGVAAAFGCPLVEDPRFFQMLTEHLGSSGKGTSDPAKAQPSSSDAQHKMAQVPEGAKMEWLSDGNPWPLVSMRNVYIFAGMPRTFKAMFKRAAVDGRFDGAHQWATAALQLDSEEVDILAPLCETVKAFPKVSIGSYPATDQHEAPNGTWCCRLTIIFECLDEELVMKARQHLVAALPPRLLKPQSLEVAEGAAS